MRVLTSFPHLGQRATALELLWTPSAVPLLCARTRSEHRESQLLPLSAHPSRQPITSPCLNKPADDLEMAPGILHELVNLLQQVLGRSKGRHAGLAGDISAVALGLRCFASYL